jgi:hypothetical protein
MVDVKIMISLLIVYYLGMHFANAAKERYGEGKVFYTFAIIAFFPFPTMLFYIFKVIWVWL